MPQRASTCAVLVLFAALPAIAGETFAIRVRPPAVGETIRVEKDETRTTHTVIYDSLGRQVVDRQEKEVETLVYRETILKLSVDNKPVSIRRLYDSAQMKTGKSSRTLALHGTTVIFQKDGNKFRFTDEAGRPIAGEDAARLDREFNDGDEKFRLENLLPKKPVMVGAEWSVDMDPPIKDFLRTGRFAVDAAWATGSGHLNKSTPAGGAQFGQILYRMQIPIVAMAVSGQTRARVSSGSKATFELTLDLCIDGTRPDATILGTAEVKATAELAPAGGGGRLTLSHKCDTREVRKVVER
jgi:hypothetical protein